MRLVSSLDASDEGYIHFLAHRGDEWFQICVRIDIEVDIQKMGFRASSALPFASHLNWKNSHRLNQ